jgi:hypothetical protein
VALLTRDAGGSGEPASEAADVDGRFRCSETADSWGASTGGAGVGSAGTGGAGTGSRSACSGIDSLMRR